MDPIPEEDINVNKNSISHFSLIRQKTEDIFLSKGK